MTSIMAEGVPDSVSATGRPPRDQVAVAAINGAVARPCLGRRRRRSKRIAARLRDEGLKTLKPVVASGMPSTRRSCSRCSRSTRRRSASIRFTAPRIPFISCVHGVLAEEEVARGRVLDPQRHRCGPLRDGHAVLRAGAWSLPRGRAAAGAPRHGSPVRRAAGCGRDAAGRGGIRLAAFASQGCRPRGRPCSRRWLACTSRAPRSTGRGFDSPYARQSVPLPAYAFNVKPYWLRASVVTTVDAGSDPLPAGWARPRRRRRLTRTRPALAKGRKKRYELAWREQELSIWRAASAPPTRGDPG